MFRLNDVKDARKATGFPEKAETFISEGVKGESLVVAHTILTQTQTSKLERQRWDSHRGFKPSAGLPRAVAPNCAKKLND